MESKRYICIDLKSFFASVECMERGLDPMTALLVVADQERTEKTICLAVTPSLKAYGLSGRARLFEVVSKVREANAKRKKALSGASFSGESADAEELARDVTKKLTYHVAPPRMALYMRYSTQVYNTYLQYVSPEDIHVYSIDEVFIDATPYLKSAGQSAYDFARTLIRAVKRETGITAAAGIGTNLYLCKVAMDIVAKHVEADEDGVRIAELDERSYRRLLWDHRPLTDFWRIGRGYAKALESNGLYTMGDVARCSVGRSDSYYNEDLLYRLFGVNAELLIDHAWGWEPCTLADIKAYRPRSNSISSGQVLQYPYEREKAHLIVHEMVELMSLELVEKRLVTDQIVLTVGYDVENLTDPARAAYKGEITTDFYGRRVPKPAHGTANVGRFTSSTRLIWEAVDALFSRIVSRRLLVRRINITANHIIPESEAPVTRGESEQMNMFVDYEARDRARMEEEEALRRERKMQEAMIEIKKKYGKNAILKGINFEEGATSRDRNRQIGGHKA